MVDHLPADPAGGAHTATVRLFAALRDAAGTGTATVTAPTSLTVVLADLESRFGDRFAARLGMAAVMVDGDPVDRTADVPIAPGSEVALLPPFAGGTDPLSQG